MEEIPESRVARVTSRLDPFERDFLIGNFDPSGALKESVTIATNLRVRLVNLGIARVGSRNVFRLTDLGDAVQTRCRVEKRGA